MGIEKIARRAVPLNKCFTICLILLALKCHINEGVNIETPRVHHMMTNKDMGLITGNSYSNFVIQGVWLEANHKRKHWTYSSFCKAIVNRTIPWQLEEASQLYLNDSFSVFLLFVLCMTEHLRSCSSWIRANKYYI